MQRQIILKGIIEDILHIGFLVVMNQSAKVWNPDYGHNLYRMSLNIISYSY